MTAQLLSREDRFYVSLVERARGLRRLLEARYYHRPRRIHPDRGAIERAIEAELRAAVSEALQERRP